MSQRRWLTITFVLLGIAVGLWWIAAGQEGATAAILQGLAAMVVIAWVAFYIYDLRQDVRAARAHRDAQRDQPPPRRRRRGK